MTNKEICIKAVAAYHCTYPNVVVKEWECDPNHEGVAIMTINDRKVAIQYNEEKGFVFLENHVIPQSTPSNNTSKNTSFEPTLANIPDFTEWNELKDTKTGALPMLLDILAVICIIVGFVLFNSVTMLWISYVVGCFVGAIALHIAAAIIRSMRATQAHAAYIEDLLVYIIASKEQ